MSLNVTVTKGHDFTTGPVTRAALNAAATPTISMTGSVSASEIANGTITGAKITGTDADAIPNSKLAVTAGSIVVGSGSPGVGSEIAAGSSGQILVGSGSTLASVAVSGDATLSSVGALSIGDTKVTGAMLNAAIVDDTTIEIDAASTALKVKSIAATNIGSGSNGGVIGFTSAGVGANIAAGSSGQVLTSNGDEATASFQDVPASSPAFETTTDPAAGSTSVCHYIVPGSTTRIRLQLVGSGGGGGGDDAGGSSYGGGGGGGGAFVQSEHTVTENSVLKITIAAGGAGIGAGNVGTGIAGTTTTITSADGGTTYASAAGGAGGVNSGGGVGAGGAGGLASACSSSDAGAIKEDGQSGGDGDVAYLGATATTSDQTAGYGGCSRMGAGSVGGNISATDAGSGYGYGGRGRDDDSSGAEYVATAGGRGHVRVFLLN